MQLYHFTSGDLFKDILASNAVLKSTIISEGELAAATAVSLTSDLDPTGHGLPSGGKLMQEQANRVVMGWRDKGGDLRARDATKWRLDFEIDAADQKLRRSADIHTKRDLRGLEIAALLPFAHSPTDDEIRRIDQQLESKKVVTKSPTWWYYFGALSLNLCSGAACRSTAGKWHVGTLQEFRDATSDASQ